MGLVHSEVSASDSYCFLTVQPDDEYMFRVMSSDSTTHGPAAANSFRKAAMTWILRSLPGQACESGCETLWSTRAKSAQPIDKLESSELSPARPKTISRGFGKIAGSWSAWATFGIWCSQVTPP